MCKFWFPSPPLAPLTCISLHHLSTIMIFHNWFYLKFFKQLLKLSMPENVKYEHYPGSRLSLRTSGHCTLGNLMLKYLLKRLFFLQPRPKCVFNVIWSPELGQNNDGGSTRLGFANGSKTEIKTLLVFSMYDDTHQEYL